VKAAACHSAIFAATVSRKYLRRGLLPRCLIGTRFECGEVNSGSHLRRHPQIEVQTSAKRHFPLNWQCSYAFCHAGVKNAQIAECSSVGSDLLAWTGFPGLMDCNCLPGPMPIRRHQLSPTIGWLPSSGTEAD